MRNPRKIYVGFFALLLAGSVGVGNVQALNTDSVNACGVDEGGSPVVGPRQSCPDSQASQQRTTSTGTESYSASQSRSTQYTQNSYTDPNAGAAVQSDPEQPSQEESKPTEPASQTTATEEDPFLKLLIELLDQDF